jgi:pantoate--beta-alanine ligase
VIIVKNQREILEAIETAKIEKPEAIIGFVPTMGALHEGHMSLIESAKSQSDIVVCSIFVNPTQFNNPDDLKTYPRTIDADRQLLEEKGCDILLLPDVKDVYPNGEQPYSIDLGGIDKSMEGAFRPGHFKGVCMVVERFFEMVQPDKAFFGKKDFQQLAVVRKMTAVRNLPIEIVGVPIKRAENGLALSSRNALLTEQQREDASLISRALKSGLEFSKANNNAAATAQHIEAQFEGTAMEVEYVAIIDNDTLEPVDTVSTNSSVCTVVYYGKVRLLDNMQFADA